MSVFVIGSIISARFRKEPAWESCGANEEATDDLISFPTFRKLNKCRCVYIKVAELENKFQGINILKKTTFFCI